MTYSLGSANHYNKPINLANFASSPEERARLEKEQHRQDLLRQIEDNNRRYALTDMGGAS